MTKAQLRWIIGLMTLATLAVVGLQGYIWQQSIEDERERFRVRVQHAVFSTTEALLRPSASSVVLIDQNVLGIRRDSLRRMGTFQVRLLDSTGVERINLMHGPEHVVVDSVDSLTGNVTIPSTRGTGLDGRPLEVHALAISDSARHIRINRLDLNRPPMLVSLADSVKPILTAHLAQQDILGNFQWGIQQPRTGDWLIVEGDTATVQAASWKFPMFIFAFDESANSFRTADVFSPPMLSLYFPDESWRVLRGIASTLIASGLLALLVIGCLGYALHTIVRQKQLSEVKTDFINNMTHELKTPISTIALACEALQDEGLHHTPEAQERYMQMIAVENERLAMQVEKVLQMALLDRNDLGLKMEPVDLHAVLRDMEAAFSMQVQQRGGTLTTAFKAEPAVVVADGLHLRQMLANLLDNANKYSPERPTIRIATCNRAAGVEIEVQDQGVGIQRDALRKIFDRFYRVPMGNRHDVKGFGLGLSYVQTMALAHGGQVRATSKPGRGSTFYLYLPYAHA